GAEIGDLSDAPSSVNAWVRKKTDDRIRNILSPQDVTQDTLAILVNTVYFKGVWTHPFETEATRNRLFMLLSGRKKTCRMMSHTDRYGYYRGDHFQMVGLPYRSSEGHNMRMVILLPDPDTSLNTLQQSLTFERWKLWTSRLGTKPVMKR